MYATCGRGLSKMQGGGGRGVVQVGDKGTELLRVGVGDGGEGEDEGHEDGGPGEFVIGGEG